MRKFATRSLVPAVGALLVVTGFVACGGDYGDTAARYQAPRSSVAPTQATTPAAPAAPTTRPATPTTGTPAGAPAEAVAAPAGPEAPPLAPPADPCDNSLAHDAIAGSGAVSSDITFEITHLKCAEGYGWAQIVADSGDGATAFLQGAGDAITVLDLGSAVCPTGAGMPESIAVQLAPEGSNWRAECGA